MELHRVLYIYPKEDSQGSGRKYAIWAHTETWL